LVWLYFLRKIKKTTTKNSAKHAGYLIFGTYKFYENQNKIVRNNLEFKLTLKESQILKIFIQNQNVIIKREQLIKEVWEDNGVIVGRSLDAFISKIRKRFENDSSINIVNIHGVGYKLEVID
jgi:DNA-binding response OmpR family regulator